MKNVSQENILNNQYLLKNIHGEIIETYEDACNRIAKHYAKGDKKSFETFSDLLIRNKIVPNTPTWYNAGIEGGDTSACYVLKRIKDDLTDIFDIIPTIAKISSQGAGFGIYIGDIRPKNSGIKGKTYNGIQLLGGISCGQVGFTRVYNAVVGELKNGGKRRGAASLSCPVSSPEIYDLINIKKNDEKDLSNFMLNILCDDEFFRAVMKKDKYLLYHDKAPEMSRYVDANELLDKMVDVIWLKGEPGVLFQTNMNRNIVVPGKKCVHTNPCVSGDTFLLTDKGHVEIESVVNTKINIWNGIEFSEVTPFSTGINDTLIVNLSDNNSLRCTPYHEFVLNDGSRIKAEDLKNGDKLQKFNMPFVKEGDDPKIDAYSQGFYSVDGNKNREYSWLYFTKYMCASRLIGNIKDGATTNRKIWRHGIMFDKRFVPTKASSKYCLEWLSGLLDADGTVTRDKNGNGLQISSTSFVFLKSVKLMLSKIGVQAKLLIANEARFQIFSDGRGYDCKKVWRLLIGNQDTHFLVNQGLKTERLKVENLKPQRNARQFVRVLSVEDSEPCETYCFNEPKNHTGTFNGIVTGQCSEITGFDDGFNCSLCAENLGRIDDDTDLKYNIENIVEFLNNGIDANNYPAKYLEDAAKNYRPIGIGFLGLSNYFIHRDIVYGSEESILKLRDLLSKMFYYAAKHSELLGIKKGDFLGFDKNLWNEVHASKMNGHKIEHMRNCDLLSLAPNGTTSATSKDKYNYPIYSGGLEPMFSLAYMKKIHCDVGFGNTESEMVIVNEFLKSRIKKYNIEEQTYIINTVLKQSGSLGNLGNDYKELRTLITAKDLTVDQHFDMLKNANDYVDMGISKTINVDKNVGRNEIKRIILKAWENGIKGVSFYRDGCRDNNMINNYNENHKGIICSSCGEINFVIKGSCGLCTNCGTGLC